MIQLGLIGSPVSHSRSPELHTAALQSAGMNGSYRCYDVTKEALLQTVSDLFREGLVGLNVTLPLKERALDVCDEVAPVAQQAGAVNTLYRRPDGTVYGTNTDVQGAMESLRAKDVRLDGLRVLVIGAGGAARAVIVGLLSEGVERLFLTNRTHKRAVQIQSDLSDPRIQVLPCEHSALARIRPDLVVHATSLGLGESCPENSAALAWFQALPFVQWPKVMGFDLIYSRSSAMGICGWTPFLHVIRENGGETLDGWDMLRHQAAASFGIWTGSDPVLAYRAMKDVNR